MKPHAFVAMPFGSKPGSDGQLIDFNRVYTEYIQPALEIAGMEVFRADQEQRAGDIITDMFQELLIADLVVADLDDRQSQCLVRIGCAPCAGEHAASCSSVEGAHRPRSIFLVTQAALQPQG